MITAGKEGVYLDIQVQPKARRPGVRGVHGQRLKIAVAAPAQGGKANQAALEAVADLLNVATRTVSLVAGRTSPRKRLLVRDIRPEEAVELIAAAIGAFDPD